jgi:hypothetical protein
VGISLAGLARMVSIDYCAEEFRGGGSDTCLVRERVSVVKPPARQRTVSSGGSPSFS